MRLPWEQVAMEVIEVSAPELGDKLFPDLDPDLAEAAAGWGVVHLVKWALARCPEHLPPSASAVVPGPTAARQIARAARFKGKPEDYVAALAALPDPVVEVLADGVRIRGLDRYDAAWGDTHREEWSAWKAAHPDRYPSAGLRRKPAGKPPEIRRPDTDTDTDADQLPSEAAALSPPPLKRVPPTAVTPPTAPIASWLAEDFWRWAEHRRQLAGCQPQGPPHASKLSGWWSTARQLVEVPQLQEAFLRFGDDPYWQKQKPVLPFAGFMSQWNDFLPMRNRNAS